jgi:hypothetical protein
MYSGGHVIRKLFKMRSAPKMRDSYPLVYGIFGYLPVCKLANRPVLEYERLAEDWANSSRVFQQEKMKSNLVVGSCGPLLHNLFMFGGALVTPELHELLNQFERNLTESESPWVELFKDCFKNDIDVRLRIELMEHDDKLLLEVARKDYDKLTEPHTSALHQYFLSNFDEVRLALCG